MSRLGMSRAQVNIRPHGGPGSLDRRLSPRARGATAFLTGARFGLRWSGLGTTPMGTEWPVPNFRSWAQCLLDERSHSQGIVYSGRGPPQSATPRRLVATPLQASSPTGTNFFNMRCQDCGAPCAPPTIVCPFCGFEVGLQRVAQRQRLILLWSMPLMRCLLLMAFYFLARPDPH